MFQVSEKKAGETTSFETLRKVLNCRPDERSKGELCRKLVVLCKEDAMRLFTIMETKCMGLGF